LVGYTNDLVKRNEFRERFMKTATLVLFWGVCITIIAYGKTEVHFSPDDQPTQHLIRALNTAQARILCAMYAFTNKPIAQTLLTAHRNGISVQVIVDESTLENRYNKVESLSSEHVPVFVYRHSSNRGLMHNKYAVVDNTVWTGSMNWTQAGNSRNQENLLRCDDPETVARYAQQFEILKKRCAHRISPPHTTHTVKTRLQGILEKILGYFKTKS